MAGTTLKIFCTQRRLAAVLDFYQNELGLTLRSSDGPTHVLQLGAHDQTQLVVHVNNREDASQDTGLAFNVTDFSAALRELRAAGVVVEDSLDELGQTFKISDPAGNHITFNQLLQN